MNARCQSDRLDLSTCLALSLALLVMIVGPRTTFAQDVPGFPPATTVQLPVFGVAVSPDGVLEHVQFAPPGGQLFRQRAAAARACLDQEIQQASQLRQISLARLQTEIRKQAANGQALSDDVLKLAGLLRVDYVFACPEQNDILIAGPAEGWIEDASGRAVGMTSGRPVVLLEDLLVALRVLAIDQPADVWVGCSIGSTAAGMERLKELQRQIPARVSPDQEQALITGIVPAIEQALGNAVVSVFGVAGSTHMVRVMIEADYRMKLIGIGREPPPVEIPVFFEKLSGAPRNNYQRWWFTPDYQCVQMTGDRLALRLAGHAVRLGAEEYKTDNRGRLIQLQTRPLRAARLYADGFTDKYQQIAAASPVFAQLRNMIDVLIAASFIQRENLLVRTGLEIDGLLDPDTVSVETQTTPVAAPCLANAHWKSGTLIAPSGGVSILASEAFKSRNLIPGNDDVLDQVAAERRFPANPGTWWWD